MALADKHKIIELEAIILEQDTKVDSEKDWVVLTETVAALNHIGNSSNQYIRSKYQTNLDWCPRDQGRRDFHMHTSISDGSLDIEDVVKELVKRVVKIAAITDHNALCAVDKYIETGARYGVIMIPAVEFSCCKEVNPVDKSSIAGDILAFFVNPHDLKLIEVAEHNSRMYQLMTYVHTFKMLDYLDKRGELKAALSDFPQYQGLGIPRIIRMMVIFQNEHYLAVYKRNGISEMVVRVRNGLVRLNARDFENFLVYW